MIFTITNSGSVPNAGYKNSHKMESQEKLNSLGFQPWPRKQVNVYKKMHKLVFYNLESTFYHF